VPRVRASQIWRIPDKVLEAAQDCGMKYLACDAAFSKLKALAACAALVRTAL